MKDKAFIDTNLLLYLYSADEIDKQNKVKSAFYHYDCFISTQVLNEFSNVLSKKWKVPVPDIKMAINEIKQYCTISFIDMNTIEKATGKKFAVLEYDKAQIVMVKRVGATPVLSDVSDFVSKFNKGQVEMVGAPAYAFKPLEMDKGLGANGALFNFPVLNVTADLIFNTEKFPSNLGVQSRDWFIKQLPRQFAMVKRLEEGIPAKYRMQLSKEEKEKYQKLLRDGRIELTKQGIYDASMMTVLKKARCTVERTNFECSLGGE